MVSFLKQAKILKPPSYGPKVHCSIELLDDNGLKSKGEKFILKISRNNIILFFSN
jgi:hypothetical protein